MAQLYFRFSTMNAGKSIEILKIAHNYEEQNKKPLLFTHQLDDRYGHGKIASRIGLSRDAIALNESTNPFETIRKNMPVDCVLIDEGQFLTEDQVIQLCQAVDAFNVPVIVYGLKTDFQNQFFPGSAALLRYADKIEEIKTVCWFCNRKATINLRIQNGKPVREGRQILIGGNESYIPICRSHFMDPDLEDAFQFFEL